MKGEKILLHCHLWAVLKLVDKMNSVSDLALGSLIASSHGRRFDTGHIVRNGQKCNQQEGEAST